MKAKHLLLPFFVALVILNGCHKADPVNDNDCVKIYQEAMTKIKADKDAAIKQCQNAGGTGVADCVARVTSEAEKLEKTALQDFLNCTNSNK